jgi:hypothetical protein
MMRLLSSNLYLIHTFHVSSLKKQPSFRHRSVLDGPPTCPRPACQAVIIVVSCNSSQVCERREMVACRKRKQERVRLTVSGLSVGATRLPSNRKRTDVGAFPCLSQNASISFFSAVVLLILKNTSLLLSVTFMLRCSDWPPSGFS